MVKITTYKFIYTYYVCLLVCVITSVNLIAQTKDTSQYHLNEVVIETNKQISLQSSKKNIEIDSVILSKYTTTSLADILTSQSTIYIKSYGNANIASTAMRGGNASHTAILWNGLNIQNAMLGQTDLSIIPSFLFESINLEYGGGSSLWGSGAIGGSIHLQNKTPFNQGVKSKLHISYGSFDTKKIAGSVLLSFKKISSSTKIYYSDSKNNYTYKDTLDKVQPNKKLAHANYTMKGIMQELTFLASSYQKINMRLWYNSSNRNLPSYTSTISAQNQEDNNLRLNADWNYNRRNLSSVIKAAYFNDKLNYVDSLSKIESKTTINTGIAESDNTYIYKNSTFNFGANYTTYQSKMPIKINKMVDDISVKTDSLVKHQLTKFALFVAYKLSFFKSKLNYNISLRKEFTSMGEIPFTGNTGLRYVVTKHIALKINANKSYRQPTLNDLYWPNSGNPNLKPEESYEADGGIELNFSKNNFSFKTEGTYFNRHTTNWIIWLPTTTSINWAPINIAKVYSRGTETKTELSYFVKDLKLKAIVNTAYVLSTNEQITSENDNSKGRQLIYTPRYSGAATVIASYKSITLMFSQNYTGYRFTSTDNTNWLMPYYIANLKAFYSYTIKYVTVEFFGSINNIFNKNYTAVKNRPMPLRNYEVGIALQFNKNKT